MSHPTDASPAARSGSTPSSDRPSASIVQLTSYPIKGCARVAMPQTQMRPAGLPHDRSFMVVGPGGEFRSQRRNPRLAVIRPEVSADSQHLTLQAPGIQNLTVPIINDGPRCVVTLFGDPFAGIDQGDAVADWLSQALGQSSRLARVPPDHQRVSDGRTPGTSGYADSCAVHLIARSSLDRLNEQLIDSGAQPVPMSRFRPNIVVDGWPEPHTEDAAHEITIGGADLAYAKLAIRCVVTTVDQESGEPRGSDVLRALAKYRRTTGGLSFGVKFAVLRPGPLCLGQQVTVTRWGESEF